MNKILGAVLTLCSQIKHIELPGMNPGYLESFITLGELVPLPERPHLGLDHPTLSARTKPSVPTCTTRFLYPPLGLIQLPIPNYLLFV